MKSASKTLVPSVPNAPDGTARNAKVTPIAAGQQTPRRLKRAAEILAAARSVFLDKGFERASVSEIAARVGVVEGLVYSYFPSKRDLLNEVLRGMYEPLIADLAESFARLEGLRSRLRFLVWRQLRVYVEEPGLSRIVLHEVRTSPEYFRSVLHDLQVRYTAFLLRTVREAVASGELPADTDAELIRSMVYGGIEHRMWALLFGRGTIDVEATADRYTAMLLGGMLAPSIEPLSSTAAAPVVTPADDVERRLQRLERIVAAGLPGAMSVSSIATVTPTPAPRAAAKRRNKDSE
ncbi:MAG: TetR/AcrR family transcriptional regulator [Burkholderiaceae bacterium]